MTFAKIDKLLVQENAEDLIQRSAAAINQLQNDIATRRQQAIKKYQSLSRLRKFFSGGEKSYADQVTDYDNWNAYTKIQSHKQQIKSARGLLMLANKTTVGYVCLSPSDARFLNIDPEV